MQVTSHRVTTQGGARKRLKRHALPHRLNFIRTSGAAAEWTVNYYPRHIQNKLIIQEINLGVNSAATPSTIVIKLGSSSIIHEKTHQPLLSLLSSIVETTVHLRKLGHRVVLVSSGAIAVGTKRMELDKKPKNLSAKQVSQTSSRRLLTSSRIGSEYLDRLWLLLGRDD